MLIKHVRYFPFKRLQEMLTKGSVGRGQHGWGPEGSGSTGAAPRVSSVLSPCAKHWEQSLDQLLNHPWV